MILADELARKNYMATGRTTLLLHAVRSSPNAVFVTFNRIEAERLISTNPDLRRRIFPISRLPDLHLGRCPIIYDHTILEFYAARTQRAAEEAREALKLAYLALENAQRAVAEADKSLNSKSAFGF